MARAIILIAFGGGAGSVFRYLTSLFVNKYFSTVFPLATFVTNVLGCFIIGLLLGIFEKQQITNNDLKFLLVTGFCGGYTTFSTFAYENISLFNSNNSVIAFLYIASGTLAGLFAVWVGLAVTK
jgi:CrcB protein